MPKGIKIAIFPTTLPNANLLRFSDLPDAYSAILRKGMRFIDLMEARWLLNNSKSETLEKTSIFNSRSM